MNNNTMAIDVTTILHALNELEKEFLGQNRIWKSTTPEQTLVLELYRQLRSSISHLRHLKAKASTDWQVLNAFLEAEGFDKMFDEPLDGIGAVSILDMLVEWLEKASLCDIYGRDGRNHVGFEISQPGRDVYNVDALENPLVRLKTKSGDSLWLTLLDNPPTNLVEMVRIAFFSISQPRQPNNTVSTIQVPEVKFNLKPDISFLRGANTYDQRNTWWFIAQAKQQFKFAMNREGARAKVATGLGMMRGVSPGPQPFIFNHPFIGWFTQPSAPNLPIAIFYASYDSWQEAGDLQNL